jgi:uncharacterized membrane protein YhiD involved in acid resistance
VTTPQLPASDGDGGFFAGEPALATISLRMAVALVAGLAVAATWRASQRRAGGDARPMSTTLVLLTLLVAMTTLVIGNNVARAFSLVGALAIVRFRTIVEDTRDTAFVIFAVVAGMALGAGHYGVCLIGIPVVAATALALGRIAPAAAIAPAERRLLVRVGAGRDPEALLRELWSRHVDTRRLTATMSARQGAALDLHFAVRLRDPERAVALVQELQATDGVQHVELDA